MQASCRTSVWFTTADPPWLVSYPAFQRALIVSESKSRFIWGVRSSFGSLNPSERKIRNRSNAICVLVRLKTIPATHIATLSWSPLFQWSNNSEAPKESPSSLQARKNDSLRPSAHIFVRGRSNRIIRWFWLIASRVLHVKCGRNIFFCLPKEIVFGALGVF